MWVDAHPELVIAGDVVVALDVADAVFPVFGVGVETGGIGTQGLFERVHIDSYWKLCWYCM